MLECLRYQEQIENKIVKHKNNRNESLVKNCRNIISLILQIGPNMLNPNMDFLLYYNPNSFHYKSTNNPIYVYMTILATYNGSTLPV